MASDLGLIVQNSLGMFSKPKTIAVIGGTDRPGSAGRTVLWNLVSSPCGATIYPIHPKLRSALGIKSYPKVSDAPEPIELAILVIPAQQCPAVVAECIEAGVKGCLIMSAGFKDANDESGSRLQDEITALLEKPLTAPLSLTAASASSDKAPRRTATSSLHRMRIIGGNSLGIMNPWTGLNASLAIMPMPPRGTVALVSQSGALTSSLLDWTQNRQIGFSALISIGTLMDVSWKDVLNYLATDMHTNSILIFMETIRDPKAFMSAARKLSRDKPIVVFKSSHTEQIGRMVASHTGAMVEDNEVIDAVLRRVGVLRVSNIVEWLGLSSMLASQPRVRGNRLGIISNSGGLCILAMDRFITLGGEVPELAPETAATLKKALDTLPQHTLAAGFDNPAVNPLQIRFNGDPERYAAALEAFLSDPGIDGVLVIISAQLGSDPTQIAQRLAPMMGENSTKEHGKHGFGGRRRKPMIACCFGGNGVAEARRIFATANVPLNDYPDLAARMFWDLWQYSEHTRLLYETPSLPLDTEMNTPDRDLAASIIRKVRETKRNLLTEWEAQQILTAYGIPCCTTRLVHSEDDAVAAADAIG